MRFASLHKLRSMRGTASVRILVKSYAWRVIPYYVVGLWNRANLSLGNATDKPTNSAGNAHGIAASDAKGWEQLYNY